MRDGGGGEAGSTLDLLQVLVFPIPPNLTCVKLFMNPFDEWETRCLWTTKFW